MLCLLLLFDINWHLFIVYSSRQNKAVRLSYDHKGSDSQEAKRIMDLGGFMMNNRVNGVLAVTRSLGDSVMKEFVVGNPFTTETELGPNDDFLILACDGVRWIVYMVGSIIINSFQISCGMFAKIKMQLTSSRILKIPKLLVKNC